MKKNISILAIAGVAAVAVQLPSQANPKKPYVGAGYSLNGLSGLTVMGRVPVAESISIRPEVAFTSFGTLFGASGTYDFTIPESKLTPYAGIGFITLTGNGYSGGGFTYGVGADYEVSDSVVLNAEVSLNGFTTLRIGAGYEF